MLSFPDIDPIIFALGPLKVRWYGLMYVLGFLASFFLVRLQIRKFNLTRLKTLFENLNFTLIISLVIGGRLGYVLFYNFGYYLHHPLEILATWEGGMSFHGGLLGVLVGGMLFCRKNKLNFWETADIYVVTIPIGLGLGRIGNFINGELFGRPADIPWAMIFPGGGLIPRHPSQLYEALLEGILLFTILWKLKDRQHEANWPQGAMLGFFLIFYGIFRCFAELFREPDRQIGYLAGFITRGQLLSCLMIVGGSLMLVWLRQRRKNIKRHSAGQVQRSGPGTS